MDRAGAADVRSRRWRQRGGPTGSGLVRVVGAAAGVGALVALASTAATQGWGSPDGLDGLDLGAAGVEELDGSWLVDGLAPGGDRVAVVEGSDVVLDLDTATAVLDGSAGCNPLLGSFTLTPSGRASFTVPSARASSCGPALDRQEQRVRRVLAGVQRWDLSGEKLVLSGPAGHLQLIRLR